MHCVACFELPLWLWACLVFGLCFASSFHLGLDLFFAPSFPSFSFSSWLRLRGSLPFDGNLVSRVCLGFWYPFVIFQLVSFLWYSIEIFGVFLGLCVKSGGLKFVGRSPPRGRYEFGRGCSFGSVDG
jgi:hypothetical protein